MFLDFTDLHGIVAVHDSIGADSGFVVSQVLKLGLRNFEAGHILIISCRHQTSHYATLLRRLNINVHLADNRIKVIDALQIMNTRQHVQPLMLFLRKFAQTLAAMSESSAEPCFVIFDDLSSWSLLCGTTAQSQALFRTIMGMCFSRELRMPIKSLILVIHEDILADKTWYDQLAHMSTCLAHVRSLQTGKSADVEAQIRLLRRQVSNSGARHKLGFVDHSIAIGLG